MSDEASSKTATTPLIEMLALYRQLSVPGANTLTAHLPLAERFAKRPDEMQRLRKTVDPGSVPASPSAWLSPRDTETLSRASTKARSLT